MPAPELVNEVLNVVQVLFLAWLAAHYRSNGGGRGDLRAPPPADRPPDAQTPPGDRLAASALAWVHRRAPRPVECQPDEGCVVDVR